MHCNYENLQMILSDFGPEAELSPSTSHNSFLVEIDFNQDISDSLRKEINMRYLRSKVNKNYKFPRVNAKSTKLRINKNLQDSSVLRSSKYFGENKKNRSLSPYESNLNKIFKSTCPTKINLTMSSKTPIPISISSKIKHSSKLPKLIKSTLDKKKTPRIYNYIIKRNKIQ
ncbi:hypothetical protein SteCoe_21515 [Stentor coeruleus]|uniref:Uncharacterized protein n=1 Tax=Stentor coeruleus TaxID=5963 RepID=A0A1R2BPD4_9CILI|nr:hypothetical protein SteCoe_21515 [Stentor coeruleus]